MNRSLYITLLLMPLLLPALTACTDGTDPLPAPAAQPRFVLQQTVQTRVTYPTDSYTLSLFEVGDVLGAFVLSGSNTTLPGERSNARYVVTQRQEGAPLTLEPELPQDAFPADAGYTYIFYYPYREGTDFRDVTHLVEADQRAQTWTDADGQVQTTHARYENSDLLWDAAQGTDITTGTDGGLTVNVAMDHAMASIVLEVPTDMMATDAENNVTGTATLKNVYRRISIIQLQTEKPEHGVLTLGNSSITMQHFGSRKEDGMEIFRAVIPPQTYSNGLEMFAIETPDGEKTYTSAFSNAPLTFESKKYYLFTVTETGLRFRGIIDNLTDEGDYYYEY